MTSAKDVLNVQEAVRLLDVHIETIRCLARDSFVEKLMVLFVAEEGYWMRFFKSMVMILSLFILPVIAYSDNENSKEINAAVLSNWPPHYLTDKDTGKPQGFAIDIMNRVAELSDVKVRYVVYNNWPDAVAGFKKHQAVLLPNMGITAERQKLYDFTSPYETFRISVFIRESTSEITQLSHLLERKVGAVETNQGLALLIEHGASNIQKYKSPEELFMALISGAVDAAVYPERVFRGYAIHSGLEDKIKIIGEPLQEIKRGIAIRKGEVDLFEKLDGAVKLLVKSNDYRYIYEKWHGKPKPFWDVKKVLIVLSTIICLVITTMLFWRYVSVEKLNKELAKTIIELKKTQEYLHDAVLRKNEAVKASNVGIWDWDLVTNKVEFSIEWKKQIGYEDHEIGDDFKEWEDRVHPDDLGSTLEIVQRSIAEGRQDHHVEFRFRHKDGSYRWILTQGSVFQDDSGNPVKMVGSHVDITERKKVEEALRESQERLKRAFENIPDVVVIYDTNLTIRYINKAVTQITGRQESEFIGKREEEIWPAEIYNSYMPTLLKAFKTGITQSIETVLEIPSGASSYLKITCVPVLDQKGKVKEILGITQDLTERKKSEADRLKLEATLRQSQKMESIGTLAGGIAHDFNNILSSIIGFTELALDEVEEDTSVADSLQEVYAAGQRAKELVSQILAFARQSDEALKPIQVGLIIEEVLKFIRSSIPTTIEIKKNIDSVSLIMGNETQIYQVLMNLCTNAAHAMEDRNGVLMVGLRDVTVDKAAKWKKIDLTCGEYLELMVSDTGVGIAPEIVDSVFDPYFTTKGPGEGTGLGLAMVHGVVESYGGKISVASTAGKGTIFTLYLPVTGKHGEHRLYKTTEFPTGSERILFVDDEFSIAKIGSRIVESLGYSVTIRTNSVEALALFGTKPYDYDLVITDMTMPNMTGDKLAGEMMKIRPDIPVILCTGYSKNLSDESAREIGIKAVAYKPIVKADLAKLVRKVLDEAQG